MHGLFIRLGVILGCLALSVVATKVATSIQKREVPPPRASPTPCEPEAAPTPDIIVREKPSAPASLSPYDIRNFIDGETQLDLTTLWNLLQIKPINYSGSDKFERMEHHFMASCSDCQAEVFEYELDGQPGNEILLKISDGVGRSTRYLIFSANDARSWANWKLLGHIDSGNDKYRMSQHKVFMGGGRSWLTITSGGATGSGVATFHDRVFLVSKSGLHEALSYRSEGHQSDWLDQSSREFFGQLVSLQLKADLVIAEVNMVVQYFGEDYLDGGDGILLWEKRQKAFFTRRLGRSEQILDRSRSTVSERELEEVYNIDSLTDEGYFEYNAKELASIARGNDPSKREWLRRELADGEETTSKRRLRQLLAR